MWSSDKGIFFLLKEELLYCGRVILMNSTTTCPNAEIEAQTRKKMREYSNIERSPCVHHRRQARQNHDKTKKFNGIIHQQLIRSDEH
jgi:hypothetical protein